MAEISKIQKSYNDDSTFNENSLQALYNFISSRIKGDALEVINSGSKAQIDYKRKAELKAQKIKKIIERIYPEYPSNPTELDMLFFIFIDLLQKSEEENVVATGKLLQYIDLVYNNRNVKQNRELASYLLHHVDTKGSKPINFKKDVVTTCKEMDKIKARSVKVTRKQISFANKYKYATDLYLSHCKVEVDLINALLELLKRAGKIQGISDNDVKKGINEIIQMYRKDNTKYDSILVEFMKACSEEFVRYFATHDSLSKEPEWFSEEYIKSETEFSKVFGNNTGTIGNFRYNFNAMIFFNHLLDHSFSDKQLQEISYDNLNQEYNRK